METRILEASLAKLCSLLAVGFGDAGGEVIGNNIKSGGDLNPMIPGHKILGIYGFCDIRQFTDATEVLQVCDACPLRCSDPSGLVGNVHRHLAPDKLICRLPVSGQKCMIYVTHQSR